MEEIWKPITNYEGLYEVSNLGNVKSLEKTILRSDGIKKHLPNRVLNPYINNDGYSVVNLYKDKKTQTFYVHRLVAEAFIQNPENKPFIDHIIPVRVGGTNEISNLRWCTIEENNNNPITRERIRVVSEETRKKRYKPILQYTLSGELIREWSCAMDAQKALGINNSHIYDCARGERKTCGGYIWKYKNEVV